ncbi:septation protein SepH [Kribbella sp. DT2]|uniref:septation protein SepH n=1 Tax=Kribbella sp. DT2 TaxID=3393427 RepID=UPI003CEAD0F2
MREARLVGLSQDGTKLVLAVAETGEEFAVPVDDRLRAALRGDRARLGQLEIQMESALRPRDIQARIRAGESVEAVAAVAQMPMERVMAFAGPVLAERDHVANLAQRASVRRRGGGDAPTRNLEAWVTERLRTRGVDPGAAEWDAWRREDGRWAVRVSYPVAEDDEKVAMFAYDAPGRYAVPDDDEARWLVGEQAQVLPPQQPERRLTAVADIDLSLAPDHGSDSYEAAGFEDTVNLTRARQQYARDNNPRDFGQDIDRDFGRDSQPNFGRDAQPNSGRDARPNFGRDSQPNSGRDSQPNFGRDAQPPVRESQPPVREPQPPVREPQQPVRPYARESFTGRDADRGPRRVHSVPSPDEEPTLINVPLEPPPALRPTVRAVERPAPPAAETAPPEERAAAPENRFTERRTQPPESRQPERPAKARESEHQAETRQAEARQADARQAELRQADAREADARRSEERQPERQAESRAPERRPEPRETETRQPERQAEAREADLARHEQARRPEHQSDLAPHEQTRQPERPVEEARRPEPADPRHPELKAEPKADPRHPELQQPARPSIPKPFDPRRGAQENRVTQPTLPTPTPTEAPPAAEPKAPTASAAEPEAPAEPAPEPKKKPARRGSKRASVPSWDEIMFGKKAD